MSNFMCSCGDDGKARAKELMEEVCSRLSGNGKWRAGKWSEPPYYQGFWEVVVLDLQEYNAMITGLDGDQWYGIGSKRFQRGRTGEESPVTETTLFMQCDELIYGLAATWKHWADLAAKEAEDPT